MPKGGNTATLEEAAEIRRRKFLGAFRKYGDMGKAAAEAEVHPRHPYNWAKKDPDFAEEFQLIRDRHYVDRLVDAMEATQ